MAADAAFDAVGGGPGEDEPQTDTRQPPRCVAPIPEQKIYCGSVLYPYSLNTSGRSFYTFVCMTVLFAFPQTLAKLFVVLE